MAIAADGDAGIRPVPADAADEAAQPSADFLTRWRLAGAQDHGDRPASGGVVDMDRQEAALIVVSVPFGELLMAVHDIERIVDVQNHRGRRLLVAGAPDIDQRIGEPDDLFQRGRVLPARDRGLGTQIRAGIRKPSAGEFEGGVGPEKVDAVAGKEAIANMRDLSASSTVWMMCAGSRGSSIRAASVLATARRRSASESKITPLSEERRPPSNAAVTFLRDTAGRENVSGLSSVMAGVAGLFNVRRMVLTPISYANSAPCATPASPIPQPGE